MPDLNPEGLRAAAEAMKTAPGHGSAGAAERLAEVAVRAYLAAAAPVTPDTENRTYTIRVCEGCGTDRVQLAHGLCVDNNCRDENGHKYPMREITVAPVAAGRAAATPDPPDMTNMCEGESPDHKPGITPAASPDERLREAAERLTRAVEVLDLSDRRLDDADPYDTLTVPQSASAWRDIRRAVADACAALAAADREAPDEGGGAMSEFRVVDANGDPYPPHAQPCRTLAAAALRRDFYQQVTSVSGEARMPVRPLRIERRSAVVSMWEPWNVGAASGLRKGASDE